jgi:hypothetical protein
MVCHSFLLSSLNSTLLNTQRSDYKKVPIAIINNQQINGSKDILNSIFNSPYVQEGLAKQWSNNNNNTTKEVMTIQQFKESDTSKKWYRFASDDLGAVLYPNICGTIGDSFHAFDYVKNVDSFSPLQKLSIQYVGSLAMYFAASKVKCELICFLFSSFHLLLCLAYVSKHTFYDSKT